MENADAVKPDKELIDPVWGHTLTECVNPLCDRWKIVTVDYCCENCSVAHELGKSEHRESCEWRWNQRKQWLNQK